MNIYIPLACLVLTALAHVQAADATAKALPDWAIGPFTQAPEPVIKPNPQSVFHCPIQDKEINWEKSWVYNPAAAVRDGKIIVLYRAQQGPGNTCSRVGYAESGDGFHFTCDPVPVFYPANDDQKSFEGKGIEKFGGCEDPRLAESPDGVYILTYNQRPGSGPHQGIASSRDLKNWTKHGSVFEGTKWTNAKVKSFAVLHEVKDGKLVAAKINGSYWMYFGLQAVYVATSQDFIHWKPVEDGQGNMLTVMTPRNGFFDSVLTEIGPQSILTKKGIVVFYNGKNPNEKNEDKIGDSLIPKGMYCGGQALFDAKNPTHYITRLDTPYIKPSFPWEIGGLYKDGTTFTEGLVLFKDKWFMYFGASDAFVGVATAPWNSGQE